jgi:hypothetical protein
VADAFARQAPTPIRSLELGGVSSIRQPVFRSVSFRGPAIGERPRDNPPEIDPYPRLIRTGRYLVPAG